jgi:hypothetical protein
MTPDKKIKILHKFHSGMSGTAAGLAFRSYFILNSDFPFTFYFEF